MKSKFILVIMPILLAIIVSGCMEGKNTTAGPTPAVPSITQTIPQPSPAVSPIVSPAPTVTVSGSVASGNTVQIKLDSRRGFIPNIQTINVGDEIVWDNYDTITVTLVSKEGLFDKKSLDYYQQFRYVFGTPGNFSFYLEDRNLNGSVIVESGPVAKPSPIFTSTVLPSTALFVQARMEALTNWSTSSERKYEIKMFKVDILNQQDMPLSIRAQIMNDDTVLEENSFTLQNLGSKVEFINQENHFINTTDVTLRLLIAGYPSREYPFQIVDQI